MPQPAASKRRRTPSEIELDEVIAERIAARNLPPPTPEVLFDSSKFEIAQTRYLVQQLNALRTLPSINLPPLTLAQVRQAIIDLYKSLP